MLKGVIMLTVPCAGGVKDDDFILMLGFWHLLQVLVTKLKS